MPSTSVVRVSVFAILALGIAASAFAQTERQSYWGAAVSFVPKWEVPTSGGLKTLAEVTLRGGEDGLSVSGSDFRVGFVRGRRLGGDAGVSFFRRSFKEGSEQGGFFQSCGSNLPSSCFFYGTSYSYGSDVRLIGIDAHKFAALATIKERVQIGLEFAGGVAQYRGTVTRRTVNGPTNVSETVDPSELSAIDSKWVPTGRVELAVGAILPAGLKVRASGGLNFPGQHVFSVTVIYLPKAWK